MNLIEKNVYFPKCYILAMIKIALTKRKTFKTSIAHTNRNFQERQHINNFI